MDPELVGIRTASARWRPVRPGQAAVAAFVVALLPIRPAWLWTTLIIAAVALPWVRGAFRRPRPYWRLSAAGLEQVGGADRHRYDRGRIDELGLFTGDGVLTVFHKFGRTPIGPITALGFEPLPLFITARRLGIPFHVLDGRSAKASDDSAPAPDHTAGRRLLDLEAELLNAAHQSRPADASPAVGTVQVTAPQPLPGRGRAALPGALIALLVVFMLVHGTLFGEPSLHDRLAIGCWALLGLAVLVGSHHRLLRTAPVGVTVSADRLRAGRTEIAATAVAATVVGPGLHQDPVTGTPRQRAPTVLAFDHRLRLIGRLPLPGVDTFQLVHALDDHGYRVIAPRRPAPRPSAYGLDGLPEIFSQVPGGRLVVADDGLGWADAAGDVVLKMPQDRIGGLELLTINGHAWLRVYDGDGEEFFTAPLSSLRIARTDLRDSARRAGLPVIDAEYDAYLSANFHRAIAALTDQGEPVGFDEPDDLERRTRARAPGEPTDSADAADLAAADAADDAADPGETAGRAAPAGALAGGRDAAGTGAEIEGDGSDGSGRVVLDATRKSRLATYAVSVLLCEAVAMLGAGWLGDELGGFGAAFAWAGPAGLLIGLIGYWLYDRNRSQLSVSVDGITMVTRLGREEWALHRGSVGGVGLDHSDERMPRLVVWSVSGRVLRRVPFPPDLAELRRACERFGLPWGAPDTRHPTAPPPEL